jgi:hypothetical protein
MEVEMTKSERTWNRKLREFAVVIAGMIVVSLQSSWAVSSNISYDTLTNILSQPVRADASAYDAKDNQGNQMEVIKVLDLVGQSAKYAAVYYTPYVVSGGYRYRVNLATSDDLVHWTYIRTLVDNADMPDIRQVNNGSWLILAHEQWINGGTTGPSQAPCRVGFKLFYDSTDLLNGTIRASWLAPSYVSDLNGTPNIYEAHLTLYNNYWAADLLVGFHYWNGTQDENAYATVLKFALPQGGTAWNPTNASGYNQHLADAGVNDLGLRDNFAVSSGIYNVQEGNLGTPGSSWEKWRVFLYAYTDSYLWPSGNGTVLQLSPQTSKGSFSFGGPRVSFVKSPRGVGDAMFVSYFIFSQGAGPGEAGNLIYYYNLSPPNLTSTVSGDLLTLSWPAEYSHWHLETQTNVFGGLGSNWIAVPNTTGNNVYSNPVDSTVGAAFYRLVFP